MARLPQIQDAFQRFMLAGDKSIAAHVVGSERVAVETRLAIYGDGYRLRLIEALQNTYPVLAELLGETDFSALAGQYVAGHESTFASIRFYGEQLAEFLAADAEYGRAPVLAELARWEWAMAAVFDAADAEPIGVGALVAIAPEDWSELSFEWIPAAQVVELEWNVPALWKSVTEEGDRPGPALAERQAPWLLWRRDLQIYFRQLAGDEAATLAAARAGSSFGELCELLCQHLDEERASLRAATLLRGWVESGLITQVNLPP